MVEAAVRVLRIARRSAVKARTQTMNQIHGLLVSAPAMLREQAARLYRAALIRTLARLRPGDDRSRPLAEPVPRCGGSPAVTMRWMPRSPIGGFRVGHHGFPRACHLLCGGGVHAHA
ncbi:hypothetical protein [Streptomyces sp. NPDC017993]|uniref:hypothetical protein n=1 Tax=Streptomyces sp. NPDC017993 TaxID=3365027 RepID=UPI003798D411